MAVAGHSAGAHTAAVLLGARVPDGPIWLDLRDSRIGTGVLLAHIDAYHRSPGADAMLTLHGGKRFLGGVIGYDSPKPTIRIPTGWP